MKEKHKIVGILLGIVLLAILNNYASRRHYNALGENMVSIYKDRLMPASYLFKLEDQLYQQQLLLKDPTLKKEELSGFLQSHSANINDLITVYSKTYLTEEEKKHWKAFLTHLQSYNLAVTAYRNLPNTGKGPAFAVEDSFKKAIQTLNNLNELQTAEGFKLQQQSSSLINDTRMSAYLEVTLLFVLGIVALRMLTITERILSPIDGKHLLN